MLKTNDLRSLRPNVKCKENVTLECIKKKIEEKAHARQIPVAFYDEQIKMGGMMNSSVADCFVVYHPDNRSTYIKFAVLVENSVVSIFDFGESKNQKKLDARQGAGASIKAGLKQANKNAEKGAMVGGALAMGALAGGVRMLKSFGGSKTKQQAEQEYYSILISIFDEVIVQVE